MENKKKYIIRVSGCDDTTTFEVKLTEQEYVLLKEICIKCTETSSYACMPIMDIYEMISQKEHGK